MTLRLTELASSDLENIYAFIAQDNPDAAFEVIQGLFGLMERLVSFPHLGRAAELGTRELTKPPFVIIYRVIESIISIEAVFHGNQRYD